ncbi:ribonuclease H-like domain-containing protein [Tanacetum coccineum]
MLKVSPRKGVIHFGKRGKLNPRYIRPFKILEQIGLVAYKLKLPEELSNVHNTFHISNLKKCLSDESLVIPMKELKLDDKLNFVEEPVEIMDREIKQLRQSRIPIIKVRWNSKRGPEFMWECEDEIHTNGQIKGLPLKTAEEILARVRERKARTTLLMAILEDHLAKFHKMTDAKEMWEAIKSRFGGNNESKKMQKYIIKQQFESFSVSNSEGLHKGYDRFQNLLSQLEIHGAGVSTEDANEKFLRSLPFSWSQVSLITRTKPGVDSLSFDDLYNNLRVFESDVKGSTGSSSSVHNVGFVSSESTSSTNDVAMISIRLKKFYKKTGRKLQFDAKEPVGFDKTKVECFNCHKTWHFARECRSKGNQDFKRRDAGNTGYKAKYIGRRLGKQEEPKALAQTLSQMSAKDKSGLGYEDQIHEGVLSYENKVFQSVFDSRSSDVKDSPVYDRFVNVEGMHVVPPPMTGIYMPPKFDFGIDESYIETLESVPKPVVNEPKAVSEPKVWSDAPIIKEYDLDHLIRDCDFHEKRMAKQVELNKKMGKGTSQGESRPMWNSVQRLNYQNKFVPTAVLTRTGRFPVNADRQNLSSQAASTSAAMKVNIARPIVNETRPRNNFYKYHSLTKRPFNITTTPKANFSNQKVNTAGDKAVSVVGSIRKNVVKTSADCNGGPVAFGGSKGYITGKGKIRTGKLDFEDVYFVKELQHFNLFSVSQMCDKKNKVLFTDTKCLVLSPDFKLPDENQVLLRVPRQNNMYSFNLENIVPTIGLACLIAKATVDESNKWHRRLGHVNFKNLNKLVKGNLVRGLP